MDRSRREVYTAELGQKLREALEMAEDGDYGVTTHLFGMEHAEGLEGLALIDVAFRAIKGAGMLKKFSPASAEIKLREGMKLARFGARGPDPLEMRVRELEAAVEELEHAEETRYREEGSVD